jgi:uncharacterized protein
MGVFHRIAHGLREFFTPQPSQIPSGMLKAVNVTRGTAIATRLEVASSGKTRRKGLLGRDHLASGEGLWIIPCESVHTFFMRFPIDLVYLDRGNRVRKVRRSVGPWRISGCISAHSVLELPAGTAHATATERGDTIEVMPAAVDDSSEPAA